MRTIIVTLIAIAALAIATVALATPGGLDSRGGHHCWTKCSSYGKYRGQYHCHRAPCSQRDIARHRAHGH